MNQMACQLYVMTLVTLTHEIWMCEGHKRIRFLFLLLSTYRKSILLYMNNNRLPY